MCGVTIFCIFIAITANSWRTKQSAIDYFISFGAEIEREPSQSLFSTARLLCSSIGGDGQSVEVVAIDLQDMDVSNLDFSRIKALPSIERINLIGSNVADHQIEQIAEFENLRILRLDSTDVTNKAIPYLNSLSELEVIELNCTSVDEHGLAIWGPHHRIQSMQVLSEDIWFEDSSTYDDVSPEQIQESFQKSHELVRNILVLSPRIQNLSIQSVYLREIDLAKLQRDFPDVTMSTIDLTPDVFDNSDQIGQYLLEHFDDDGDGRLTGFEFDSLAEIYKRHVDSNGDHMIDESELAVCFDLLVAGIESRERRVGAIPIQPSTDFQEFLMQRARSVFNEHSFESSRE